jgi:AbrB family looped-hinge helix DNA binding protein
MAHILYIDRAGRVVIPKAVRERYGLRPGEPLELLETGDELRLRPHAAHAAVVRSADGAISFEGELPPDFDVVGAVDAVRAARAHIPWR